MSPKNPSIIAGLAAPGLLWLATSVALGQELPSPPGPSSQSPTSSTTYKALLLSNGKVVRGEITLDPSGAYRLKANGGPVTYPKLMVLKAGGSVEELYQFQVARLPVGDTGERMKLIRWCLTEQMHAQAKEQLEAIQQLCPSDTEVQRMLYNLNAMAAVRPRVDGEIRRTSGEMPKGEVPGSLDPLIVKKVQRQYHTLPVIFDLSQTQAVVRANEFVKYVQPVLQKNCVKCHNDKYQGQFQLVEITIKRDAMNPDVARANLDATLRLVNPDDPTRSELLSASLVPHGGNKNAIFRGPNDPPYTILLTWVKSLRPAAPGPKGNPEAGGRPVFEGAEPANGDGFAADRSGKTGPTASYPTAAYPPNYRPELPNLPGVEFAQRAAAAAPPMPALANVQSYEATGTFLAAPGDNPQFPTPMAIGEVPPSQGSKRLPLPRAPRATEAAPLRGMVPVRSGTAIPPLPKNPEKVVITATGNPNELLGMDQPLYPNSPKADPEDAAEAAKLDPAQRKPKKIDNALLEKLMKNRNGGTP